MKKKLTVLFLCSVIAGAGFGFKGIHKAPPKQEVGKAEVKPAEPTPLSFLSDEDLMKESS
jgi:hypothetical protein